MAAAFVRLMDTEKKPPEIKQNEKLRIKGKKNIRTKNKMKQMFKKNLIKKEI